MGSWMRASRQRDPAMIRGLELSAPPSIPQAGRMAGNGVNDQLRQVGETIHVLDVPQLHWGQMVLHLGLSQTHVSLPLSV